MIVRRVSASEACTLVATEGFAYIDVRSIEEISVGVPAGAYHVPLSYVTAHGTQDNHDFIRVMQACFRTDAKLVIGCDSGVRSLRAAQQLMEAGFSCVIDQRAGWSGDKDAFGRTLEPGWRACGLPISDEPVPERSYGALSQRRNAT
jgi:rhodanese-related sulfurtransferase